MKSRLEFPSTYSPLQIHVHVHVRYLKFKCVNDNNDVHTCRSEPSGVLSCRHTDASIQMYDHLHLDIVRNHNSKTFHLSFRLPTTSRTRHIHSKAAAPQPIQNGLHQHRRHRRTRQRPRRATRSPPNHHNRRHETQPISIASPLFRPPSSRRRYHCPLLVRTHNQACGTIYAGLCV